MFHAQIDDFQIAQPSTACRYFVLGRFTPDEGPAAECDFLLAHMLGAGVVTASGVAPPYADLPLIFRTRRLFAKSLEQVREAIDASTCTIIYPSGLGFGGIEKPRWASRRMEEWRRFRLSITAAWKAKSCVLVLEKNWLTPAIFLALAITKPLGVRLVLPGTAPYRLASKLTGKLVPDISLPTAKAQLTSPISAANHPEYFALRATARRLERETPQNASLVQDLRQIYDTSIKLRRIGGTFLQNKGFGAAHPADMSRIIAANKPSETIGISRFMLHHNLTQTHPFPLNTHQQKSQYIDWYINAPVNRNCTPSLPIPRDSVYKQRGSGADVETLFTLAHRVEDLAFLDDETFDHYRKSIGGEDNNISRMELLCAIMARLQPTNRTMFLEPWKSTEIRAWYQHTVCAHAPAMQIFATGRPSPKRPRQHIAIKGITNGQSGLARNAMMSKDALQAASVRCEMDEAMLSTARARKLLKTTTLHHINADQIPQGVLENPSDVHIGFLLWELECIPQSHQLAADMLDEIWVPSRYLKTVYEQTFARSVVNIGKGIRLPKIKPADMSPYGISRHHHVVLTCFDAHSSVERKNPLAAVEAFLDAHESNPNARMLVKTTPIATSHWGDPNGQMQKIHALSNQDSRIIIDQRMLPFLDLLALIKRADVVVSAHRAEGFGYIPAFALGYATPVISTDYSGTTDLCTPHTAFPIGYELHDVKPNEVIHPVQNATWANIDKSALAKAMRFVSENPEVARDKATVGQKLIQGHYSIQAHTNRYLRRLTELGVIAP